MVSTTRRAAAATVMTLVASSASFFAATGPANGAAACTPADAPPQVLAVTAEDVTFVGPGPWFGMHAIVRNACGGTAPDECDRTAPTATCTGLELNLRRSGTVGTQARACSHGRPGEDYHSESVPTGTPDVYDYPMSLLWTLEALDDTGQPAMTNACAGPWDVIARARNTTKVNDTWTTTYGDPFTTKAAFSLYRGSRLTTNASPEPVRRGETVTVKGRLTRQMLAADSGTTDHSERYVGFAGQPVALQRRTLSGTYNTIRTVTSIRGGYVTTKVKALPEDRCYRFVYRGSATTLAVTGGGDCVHVVR